MEAFPFDPFPFPFPRTRGDFSFFTGAASSPRLPPSSMRRGLAAIKDTEYVKKCQEDNQILRENLSLELRKINIACDPSFANFLLLQFLDRQTANSADQFLNINGIIVRNVSNYGLESSLRISVGTSTDCEEVIKVLTKFQEQRNAI